MQIDFKLKLEPAEANGQTCKECGDIIFLRCFKILFFIENRPVKLDDEIFLCGSCGDIYKPKEQ